MTEPPDHPTSSESSRELISLAQLIALNDQIVSLTRLGVPLEMGLREFGEEDSTTLGRVSTVLANRLSGGESLSDALAAEGQWFPRMYRVIVEAGLKTGRLTAALEAVSTFGGELIELRRRLGLALIYPVIVFLMAYGLFVVFVSEMSVRFYETYRSLQIRISEPVEWLLWLRQSMEYWVWVPPLLVVLGCLWWYATRRVHLVDFGGAASPLRLIPGMRAIERNFRLANFSDLLALLVEQGVPLNEALTLSADATGTRQLREAAVSLAQENQLGHRTAESKSARRGLPAFLKWIILRGRNSEGLARSLRLAADMYRRRAEHRVEWLKLSFPILAGVGIGGAAVMFYALALYMPLVELLRDLAI